MDRRSELTQNLAPTARLLRAHWMEAAIFALACGLALMWFGRGAGLLILPFGLLAGLLIAERRAARARQGSCGGEALRPLRAAIDARFLSVRASDATFALILARIDAGDADGVATSCLDRLSRVVRDADQLFDLGEGRLAILLAPGPGLDHAALTALGTRLRDALSGPAISAPGAPGAPGPGVSLGICMAGALSDRSGRAMIRAADSALAKAAHETAPAIRFHGQARPNPPRARPETA